MIVHSGTSCWFFGRYFNVRELTIPQTKLTNRIQIWFGVLNVRLITSFEIPNYPGQWSIQHHLFWEGLSFPIRHV